MKKMYFLSIVSISAILSWDIYAQDDIPVIPEDGKTLSENDLDSTPGIPTGNGALPPGPEQLEYIKKNFVERDYCPPTKLGLERMNEARVKKGLSPMTMEEMKQEAKENGRIRKIMLKKELEMIEKEEKARDGKKADGGAQ